MKVLIVEDDVMIAKGLSFAFLEEGYDFSIVHNLKDAEKEMDTIFDLVVLDVMLPDGDSFSFCKKIKEEKKIPVIFLTAKDDEEDVVYGFDMGADDYVIKPFRVRELLSRMNRLTKKDKVYKGTEEIILTSLEYRILSYFFLNQGQILTRDTLLSKIWDDQGNFVNDNTLTVYIKRLREKLGSDIIQTVKGVGYRVMSS